LPDYQRLHRRGHHVARSHRYRGTRGIGEAISLALKGLGYQVAANYGGNDAKAQAFTDATGIPAYKWDVGDHQACVDGCAKVAAELGPIDIVVNNAGITRDGVLQRMSFEDWDEVIRVNLGGCFNMAKATFRACANANGAASSTSARSTGRPGNMGR
jgi:acetoacetyl-CoA reductase